MYYMAVGLPPTVVLRKKFLTDTFKNSWPISELTLSRTVVKGCILHVDLISWSISFSSSLMTMPCFFVVCVCKVYYYKHTIWFQILQEVIDNLETCILNLPPSVTNLPNIVTRWFNLFKLSGDSTLFTLSKCHVPLRVGACHVKSPS